MDPVGIPYSLSSQPYGQQFPSYVPNTMSALLGTTTDTVKVLPVDEDVVYGNGSAAEAVEAVNSTSEEVPPRVITLQTLDRIKSKLGMEGSRDEEVLEVLKELRRRRRLMRSQEADVVVMGGG